MTGLILVTKMLVHREGRQQTRLSQKCHWGECEGAGTASLVKQPEWMSAAPGSCVHKGSRDPWEHPWLTPTLICRVNDVLLTRVHSLLFGKKYFLFFYRIPIKMKVFYLDFKWWLTGTFRWILWVVSALFFLWGKFIHLYLQFKEKFFF